jgi:malonyl-CoA O-methyltransferase
VDERFSLDTAVVRRSFNRAAQHFDEAAIVHREVRSRALERLLLLRQAPNVILDLGAGTGHGSAWLNRQFPKAQVIAIDSAFGMLMESNRQRGSWRRLLGRSFSRACGDASALPLRSGSVDWVVSNLMLPWCSSIETVFAEVRRVLKSGGVFAFTSFGPDTLRELRQAWRQVDAHEHVHPFIDMHDLGDALIHAGFAEPVLDVERITLTYADIKSLLNELKAGGSSNALPGRARGLTTRTLFEKLTTAYDSFRLQGKLPTTYEVVYGQAWQSAPTLKSGSQSTKGGETKIPLASVGIRHRRL